MTCGDEPIYDRSQAIQLLGGDEVLFGEIAAVFRAECEGHCRALETALASGNAVDLRLEAHTVKSVLASFACEAGRDLARRLELLTAEGSLDGADGMTAELVSVMRRLAGGLETEIS